MFRPEPEPKNSGCLEQQGSFEFQKYAHARTSLGLPHVRRETSTGQVIFRGTVAVENAQGLRPADRRF